MAKKYSYLLYNFFVCVLGHIASYYIHMHTNEARMQYNMARPACEEGMHVYGRSYLRTGNE